MPIDNFTKAYLAAALWANELDDKYDLSDIAQTSLKSARLDCELFQSRNKALLDIAYSRYKPLEGYTPQCLAGHDFWLTRDRCGAGFWGRELGDVGNALKDASQIFNELSVYVVNELVYID